MCRISVLLLLIAPALLAAPVIECDSPLYDFGTLSGQDMVSHEFVLWNRGDSPVVISEVKGCCGIHAVMTSMEILPGSNTVCKATFSTRNRHGKQIKRIQITSNARNHPSLELRVEGVLLKSVDFSPRIVRFEAMSSTNGISKFITVTNLLDKEVELLSVSSGMRGITADIKESNARDWLIELKATPEVTKGRPRGTVQLNFSFGAVNVPIIAAVQPVFRVLPEQGIQYTSSSAKRTMRLVTLTTNDGSSFKVLSADLHHAEGSVDFHNHGDSHWKLRVSVVPDSIQPHSFLQIRTSSLLQPYVTVPLIRKVD